MENKNNDKHSAKETPSVSHRRHEEAKEFTKTLIEELLSSDSGGALARTPDEKTNMQ
ncbi:MAG: hypothetical protein IJ554_04930 [Paludibacteraceae bacterium]|nr:hypothetical protein [Paludibacteraceae bacterium]